MSFTRLSLACLNCLSGKSSPLVVQKLRSRAAAQGISVEEAHRRLLRAALLGDKPGPQRDFIAYLRGIPTDDSIEFTRATDPPRKVDL